MALRVVASAAGEKAQLVLEERKQRLHRQRSDACRGKLDRERQALETTADLTDGLCCGIRELECGCDGTCAGGEEAHGLRERHGIDGELVLSPELEDAPARNEHPYVRARRE